MCTVYVHACTLHTLRHSIGDEMLAARGTVVLEFLLPGRLLAVSLLLPEKDVPVRVPTHREDDDDSTRIRSLASNGQTHHNIRAAATKITDYFFLFLFLFEHHPRSRGPHTNRAHISGFSAGPGLVTLIPNPNTCDGLPS